MSMRGEGRESEAAWRPADPRRLYIPRKNFFLDLAPMSLPSSFPRFESLAVDLPVSGAPVIAAGAAGASSSDFPAMLVSVIPVGGRPFDATLFAIRKAEADNVVRLGSKTAPSDILTMAEPVSAPDRNLAWRLFERGSHPGDVRLAGETDEYGRQAVRVLVLLDFSQGLTASDDLTMPLAFRRALAEAMEVSSQAKWQVTAEALDPGRALRGGRADETQEVFTMGAIEAALAEEAGREAAVAPMRDFRFADNAELVADLKRAPQILSIARPDMAGMDRASQRMSAMADAFEAGDLAEFKRLHDQASWLIANMARVQGKDGNEDKAAMGEFLQLMQGEGTGAGAAYFRDMVADHGVIDTLEARLKDPAAHVRFEALGGAMKDAKLRQLALEPTAITVRRTAEEIGNALLAKDSAARLPVLALDDNPLARGKALPDVLMRAAIANPAAVRNLDARTGYLLKALEKAKSLGSRDPSLPAAIDRLERGSDLLAVIVKDLPKVPAGISGAVMPQRAPEARAVAALKPKNEGLMR